MLSFNVGHISLYILWDCGTPCLNVQSNVIALGGANIAFHGLLILATTRLHRSTGLGKHNLGRRAQLPNPTTLHSVLLKSKIGYEDAR